MLEFSRNRLCSPLGKTAQFARFSVPPRHILSLGLKMLDDKFVAVGDVALDADAGSRPQEPSGGGRSRIAASSLVLARLFLGAGEGALFTGSVGWILAHTE
jgi:hypothetical protein